MTLFPGRDRGRERHDSLLESSCWNLPALCATLTALHKRMTESWEKLQVEKIKASLLHSFQALATGDTAALHLQLCIQPLQLVSHGKQQTPSEAACSNVRTKTGQLLLLLYFDYIKRAPVTAFFFFVSAGPYRYTRSHKTTLPVLHETLDIHFSAHYQVFYSTCQHRHPQREYPLAPAQA